MLVVGLTGGIASGKTTISKLFSDLGAAIVDTDVISRELLEPGQPGYQKIRVKLGDSILHNDKSIDRPRLRQLVFNDDDLKTWLESILHPLIYQTAKQNISRLNTDYCLLVVPLLFESKFNSLADRILVVDCSRETQLNRLLVRDNIDESLANSMLDQQWSNRQRLSKADEVIVNEIDSDLESQVKKLHRQYLNLAKSVRFKT